MRNYIVPKANDIIEYCVKGNGSSPKQVRVISVHIYQQMYDRISILATIDEPDKCIEGSNRSINIAHITKIIKYSKQYPRPLNLFYNKYCYNRKFIGSISGFVIYALSKQNINLPRSIDYKRASKLYEKNGVGLKFCGYSYTLANKKKFKKWVNQNLSKIMVTVKEQKEIDRMGYVEEKLDYERDMAFMMDEMY